ncbi:hypothetical protein AB6A40_008599 [Gnathostoma spinigerum]|uniref:ABC transporter domain-containing protein n=1 Tax=Gnathostoma spinigerum TaxID=75299 RepID=A0ABD6EPI8_9BILA
MDAEKCRLISSSTVSYYDNGSSFFDNDLSLSSSPTLLAWHNITVNVEKTNQHVLNDVSGIAQPRQITALMGASGAGKSTLLNTFSARNLKGLQVTGRVTVNGNEIGTDMTRISGYVQQDELFPSTLTVNEHLFIQSRIRLPEAFNDTERERRINQVVGELDLVKCRNTRIGLRGVKKGISGGEAKRLAFASELLSNPAILFCDEPTTGLDSSMAENVVKVLSRLAHGGCTIVCSIHQPGSVVFNLFDCVLFLADGRTAYMGPPVDVANWLEKCGHKCPNDFNPADLVIQVSVS